jgi:1-deoxy-D-xylulose-5-phosphate reductoisomerase
MPAVLSAANEEAVGLFLNGRLSFGGIVEVVRDVMAAHDVAPLETVDDVLSVDAWARRQALSSRLASVPV